MVSDPVCKHHNFADRCELCVADLRGHNGRLVEAASALCDALEICHICKGQVIVDVPTTHCEDCSGDCDYHDEPNCPTIESLCAQLRFALKQSLAQSGQSAPGTSGPQRDSFVVGGPYPNVTICRRVPEQDDLEVGHIGLEPLCELVVKHLVKETQQEAQVIVDLLNGEQPAAP